MPSSPHRFFLLDAMALIYRAYFALQKSPRMTSYGKNTSASFGFTNALIDILKNENPSHLAVVFDSRGPTERHEQFSDYKAHRQAAPEDLIDSLEDIKEIIRGFNIPIYELSGYEADDIIGTIALQLHPRKDMEVYMVTPDKDYGQLVRDNIFIYKPPFMNNGFVKMTEKDVCERWNLSSVHQVVDMLALMGDASDNIPGIPGIGEKTASKLLAEYHTLENILRSADLIKGSIGEKIRKGKESAMSSQFLARIMTDVPIAWREEECKIKSWNADALKSIFQKLEFKTMARRLFATEEEKPTALPSLFAASPTEEDSAEHFSDRVMRNIRSTDHDYILLDSEDSVDTFLPLLEKASVVCIDTETTGLDAHTIDLVGISFCFQAREAYYMHCKDDAFLRYAIGKLKHALSQPKEWIGHNIKFDLQILWKYDIRLQGRFFDTMIAQYALGTTAKKSMDAMSEQYLDYQPISFQTLLGDMKVERLREVDPLKMTDYAAEDADITFQLSVALKPLLEEKKVDKVFYHVENPLIPALAGMEYEGVRIDAPFLNEYGVELQKEMEIYQARIYEYAGETFNISSPKQLGEVLFEKMKLNGKVSKTKTQQRATGEEILKKMMDVHPIVGDILEFREITKLKSTYVDALPRLINPITGRVHTSFNQTVAITGRLSSQRPNLQNIPIRTERGKKIRRAFIPKSDGYLICSADYSQIELRIVAAISGDENMREAFLQNRDIHTATAARVYGIPEEQVTKEMRYRAKSVNFGIIYGQGAWGLAENLNIPVPEAKSLIHRYFEEYKGIKRYMDEQILFARKNGFVETLMGRKRYLDGIHSANATVRGFAERNAINSPIQGTAADMIKLAMISIFSEIEKRKMKSKMILQVHDELVFDAYSGERDELTRIVSEGMEGALSLPNNVPVKIDMGWGDNWLEAH